MNANRVVVMINDRWWPATVTDTAGGGDDDHLTVVADCGVRRTVPPAEVWTHRAAQDQLALLLRAADDRRGWRLLQDLIMIRRDAA